MPETPANKAVREFVEVLAVGASLVTGGAIALLCGWWWCVGIGAVLIASAMVRFEVDVRRIIRQHHEQT